jgi:hypothetical protein
MELGELSQHNDGFMGWMVQVQFLAMQNCSFLHSIQTGLGAYPVSCPMGTWGSFPVGKAAGA